MHLLVGKSLIKMMSLPFMHYSVNVVHSLKVVCCVSWMTALAMWFWENLFSGKLLKPNFDQNTIWMNLPPVHLTHCTGHLNTTQTGKVNIKVRKTTNCKSTACAGCCAAMKIESEKSNCITLSSTITNFDKKNANLMFTGMDYTPQKVLGVY